MPRSVYFIANTEPVVTVLAGYFKARGWQWLQYPLADMPAVEYLLVLEPFQIGMEMYSLSNAWKPWLMGAYPQTRLIVASFQHSRHSNCLNLLDLPDNINTWLEKTRPVSDFPLVDSGVEAADQKYVDPWNFDLVRSGQNLNERMKKFVTGHEEAKSFFALMTTIRKDLKDLETYRERNNLEKAISANKSLNELWEYFDHRWNYYSSIFDYLPYQNAIRTIANSVEFLRKNLPEDIYRPILQTENDRITAYSTLLKKLPVEEIEKELDTILNTMRKDMEPYIFIEKEW